MRHPSREDLPAPERERVRALATALADAGYRSWIVGGTVRDLALERDVADVDMATDALPEEIERVFDRTIGVGRAFGTVVVVHEGVPVEVTTLRRERGYSDRRRPDAVEYSKSVEEDAARRDFTCNAMFLEPLDDVCIDPTGGLADLEAGLLRCVGAPGDRFREDGLRLVRLGRFAAALGLAVEPATEAAARREVGALAGVSVERRLTEIGKVFRATGAALAIGLWERIGLFEHLVPGLDDLGPDPARARAVAASRLAALEERDGPAGLACGLAVLLDPVAARGGPGALGRASFERATEVLDDLRPSRRTRATVLALWRLQAETRALLAGAEARRAEKVRLVREPEWPLAARLLRSVDDPVGDLAGLAELEAFAASASETDLRPPPWLRADDLERAGVPRGPGFGEILTEAETLTLDGELVDRDAALAWLAERARALPPG